LLKSNTAILETSWLRKRTTGILKMDKVREKGSRTIYIHAIEIFRKMSEFTVGIVGTAQY
jgi:hypothetical protein